MITAAASTHALRSSIALVFFHTDGSVFIGSGTCIRIGNQYFIATAAHNFLRIESDDQIVIVKPDKWSREHVPFIRRNSTSGDDDDNVDVGWIELSFDVQAELNRDFVPLERLRPSANPIPGTFYLVLGSPAQFVSKELLESGKLAIEPMTLLTYSPEQATSGVSVDPRIDMLLDYSGEARRYDSTRRIVLPEPHGMSGGSIWEITPPNPGQIWSPDGASIVGIEKSWIRGKCQLKGTQVRHWLNLISNDFPDLSKIIKDAKTVTPSNTSFR